MKTLNDAISTVSIKNLNNVIYNIYNETVGNRLVHIAALVKAKLSTERKEVLVMRYCLTSTPWRRKMRFTTVMKEHTIMENNLSGDEISSILFRIRNLNNDTVYNELVGNRLIYIAALVKAKLRLEEIRYVELKNEGKLDEKMREELLNQIMDLKEEYEDLISRSYLPHLLKSEDIVSPEWRYVFRTSKNRDIIGVIVEFMRIYNKWTTASVELLLTKELRDIDCKSQDDDTTDDYNQIISALSEEYAEKINRQEELLRAYLQDLHDIAEKLVTKYGIFDLLEKGFEEYDLIDTPGGVDSYIGINKYTY